MDRRALLGGLAAALVVAPALAQTSGSPSTTPSGSSGAMPMNRAAGQMSQADMQHMQQTMQLGMVALESSRIAMNKVRNDDLKRFANFEVQEQTTLSEVLRSMMDPGATAATGSASGQSGQSTMPPMQMDASARDMMQKMQNQQAGAEFDKMYLEAQLQGHRDLLQVQERYLQSNPQNREHMNVAKMARGHIREHIAMLEEMQKTMR
jgi:putative membrane protein